jgi:ubiquinone/menaquinone biosynthesis C-methylase UbiE
MYFLLHEQPEAVRRATIAEAFRVVKPGGKIVLIDYHRPAIWHPMRPLLRGIFHWLEPFAIDLWAHGIEAYFPADITPASVKKTTFFGGVYQRLVLTR